MTIKPEGPSNDAARMSAISNGVHALLFSEGGALTFKSIAKMLSCDEAAVKEALSALQKKLDGTGLSLVVSDTEASLAVVGGARDVVMQKVTEEYEREVGDAGLEVLAILLYEGPSTRATIDYIRGVNSSSSIRNLLARGLVERSGNPEDGREFIYRATTELLAHLGVTGRDSLPEYGIISGELSSFKATLNHGKQGADISGDGGD